MADEQAMASVEQTDDEFFGFEGEIPAEHPVNPLKKLPLDQVLLDQGMMGILKDSPSYKEFDFKGEVFKRSWPAKKLEDTLCQFTGLSPHMKNAKSRIAICC